MSMAASTSTNRTWASLMDALRTLFLAPTSEVRQMLDSPWAHRHLVCRLAAKDVLGRELVWEMAI